MSYERFKAAVTQTITEEERGGAAAQSPEDMAFNMMKEALGP